MAEPQTIHLNTSGLSDLEDLRGVHGRRAQPIVEGQAFDSGANLQRADLDQEAISGLTGGSGGSPRGNLGRT